MQLTKKIDKSFFNLTNVSMKPSSQLNGFSILEDYNNQRFMNIFRSVILSKDVLDDDRNFFIYQVEETDHWDTIAQKVYRTPYLWWVIATVNGITNPFEELDEGTELKIISIDLLYDFFQEVKELAET